MPKSFTPIGELVDRVRADSALAGFSSDWKAVPIEPAEWHCYISLEQGLLALVHDTSLTKSETKFDVRNTITEQLVFVLDRDGQRCEDGHWVRLHGLKAEQVLRVHGHKPN